MQREIKFRAWHTRSKTMQEISPYNLGPILSGDVPEYIAMQYTGLKDKNGKEIYEGDIAKSYIHQITDTGIVGWIHDECKFAIVTKQRELIPLKDAWPEHSYEVIGNIHKNPELCTQINTD